MHYSRQDGLKWCNPIYIHIYSICPFSLKFVLAFRLLGASPMHQFDFAGNVCELFDKCQAAVAHQVLIDRADLPAKDAVDGNAQSGGFPIHGPAATDDEVGEPDEIQAVDRVVRNHDTARGDQVSPLLTELLPLPRVARKDDAFHLRLVSKITERGVEQN